MKYEDKPSSIGFYWLLNIRSSKPPRVVEVCAYSIDPNDPFFVNECTCASTDNEIYNNHMWAGPIPEPSLI